MYPYLINRNDNEYLIIDKETIVLLEEIISVTTYMQKERTIPKWYVQIQFKNKEKMFWMPPNDPDCWTRQEIVRTLASKINYLLQNPSYGKKLPRGRLGIYHETFTQKCSQQDYHCIIEVEELEQIIDANNVCFSKVRNLEVTTSKGKFLSQRMKEDLLSHLPTWIKTNQVFWKKSDKTELTHPIEEIRNRAKAKMEEK